MVAKVELERARQCILSHDIIMYPCELQSLVFGPGILKLQALQNAFNGNIQDDFQTNLGNLFHFCT